MLVHIDRVCQLHQHDVVVQGFVVVTLMPVDGINRHVLLGSLMRPDVVVTQDSDLGVGTGQQETFRRIHITGSGHFNNNILVLAC